MHHGSAVKQHERQKLSTYLTGEGDDARSRRLSVFRGLPWGSEGLRGGRKVTEAVEEFLCPSGGRPLSLEDWRELSSSGHSSEMDVRVVVLDAVANGGDSASSLRSPLAADLAEK